MVQAVVLLVLGVVAWMCNTIRMRLSKRVKTSTIEDQAARDGRIYQELAVLRDRLQAQRVYISQFHNGDYYVDNSEVKKKTRTHEVCADGVAYQQEAYRGMVVSSVPDEMDLVLAPGPAYKLVRDLPHGKFMSLCIRGGTKAVARQALRKDGKLIGFIGVDFDNEEPREAIGDMANFAMKIEGLLA